MTVSLWRGRQYNSIFSRLFLILFYPPFFSVYSQTSLISSPCSHPHPHLHVCLSLSFPVHISSIDSLIRSVFYKVANKNTTQAWTLVVNSSLSNVVLNDIGTNRCVHCCFTRSSVSVCVSLRDHRSKLFRMNIEYNDDQWPTNQSTITTAHHSGEAFTVQQSVCVGKASRACQTDGVLKLGQEERCSICCLARVNIMVRWPSSCTVALLCHRERQTHTGHTAALHYSIIKQLQVHP